MRVMSMATAPVGALARAPRQLSISTKNLIRLCGMQLVLAFVLLAQTDDVRARMAAVLRYTGVENPAAGDVARMADLWAKAQQPGLATDVRRLVFRDMYLLCAKLQGRDLTARPQALDGLAQLVTTIFEAGGRLDLTLPEPRGKPSGNYLHIETKGNGPTPLLLISDLGIDGRKLYGSFIERQARAYRMHVVTLPYAGSARPLPWPEYLDHTRPWLTQIENELLAVVDNPRMKGVTVIGTAGGGYFAARLALLRPNQVRSVVLVNALVHTSMRAQADPDAPASSAERLMRAKAVTPGPQLFPIAPLPPPDKLKRLIDDPRSRHPIARNWMAFAVKDPAVSRDWSFQALSGGYFIPSQVFGWELTSTDLTAEMKGLTVPVVAMASWQDESSPAVAAPIVSQWEELKLMYPAIPLQLATFDDTRLYISADAPEEFDGALADFLAGRPVQGKAGFVLPRASPRASLMQAVGDAEIGIVYGRPAVKDRKIWGGVVPNGRVWRAGANEATQFVFKGDVRIAGHALTAGTYTFFAIPGETDWTLIFNRVPRQWGAFDYNPAFDVLRFAVRPAESPYQEFLRYAIEPVGASAADVTLAWEKRKVSFRIEVSP
jgi:pimeloyl-ACP methyl ester carboxylesterase